MGSSRMMDECDITLFSSFFCDATKNKPHSKKSIVHRTTRSQCNLFLIGSSVLCQQITTNLKYVKKIIK